MDLQELDNIFSYHPATPEQAVKHEKIRTAAKEFARIILKTAPRLNASSDAAILKVKEAMYHANAAISLYSASWEEFKQKYNINE